VRRLPVPTTYVRAGAYLNLLGPIAFYLWVARLAGTWGATVATFGFVFYRDTWAPAWVTAGPHVPRRGTARVHSRGHREHCGTRPRGGLATIPVAIRATAAARARGRHRPSHTGALRRRRVVAAPVLHRVALPASGAERGAYELGMGGIPWFLRLREHSLRLAGASRRARCRDAHPSRPVLPRRRGDCRRVRRGGGGTARLPLRLRSGGNQAATASSIPLLRLLLEGLAMGARGHGGGGHRLVAPGAWLGAARSPCTGSCHPRGGVSRPRP